MNKVICILGATATGKTDLSLFLAKELNGEIISVDSAMVYRGMNIGTAKPTQEERADIPHHLIDILEPEQTYSAAQFCEDVQTLVKDIRARGNVPILAGGTMMYFNALFEGLSDLPKADADLRFDIEKRALSKGWPALHSYLETIDPTAAARIKPNDQQRISRAIEVYELTGENITSLCEQKTTYLLGDSIIKIALDPSDRSRLHKRIEKRFKSMINKGFIDEVTRLHARPNLNTSMPSMRCVGYRQAWQYLDDEYGYEVMVDRGIVATRQLAKRQMTWLRGMKGLTHFHYDEAGLQQMVMEFISTST